MTLTVELRAVEEEDLEIFFEQQREPAANRMARFPPRERDAFMTHWREKVLHNATTRKLAIVSDGAVVGNIVSWGQDGKRYVGYWLGSWYWGKGLATAALGRFVAEHETARPLHAFVALDNVASIRVLEKSGFSRDGAPMDHDGVEEIVMTLR